MAPKRWRPRRISGPRRCCSTSGCQRLDGYEACRQIRALPNGRNILVVALTGWGQLIDRERTKAAGFTCHLVKPVDYSTLLSVLNDLRQESSLPS